MMRLPLQQPRARLQQSLLSAHRGSRLLLHTRPVRRATLPWQRGSVRQRLGVLGGGMLLGSAAIFQTYGPAGAPHAGAPPLGLGLGVAAAAETAGQNKGSKYTLHLSVVQCTCAAASA